MTKSLAFLATVAISALSAGFAHAEDIKIKISTLAERSAPGRVTNIEGAAEIMNRQFKAAGVDKRIVIEANNSRRQGLGRSGTGNAEGAFCRAGAGYLRSAA